MTDNLSKGDIMETSNYWSSLKDKHRIVIKIGSSSLIHKKTGSINYSKIEKLVRIICDLKSMDKEVILVSSGAVAIGRETLKIKKKPLSLDEKQACASIGQSNLMATYSKIFSEYDKKVSQILLTRMGLQLPNCCTNIKNTVEALLRLGVIPIANENDTVSPEEIIFGDNDTLSAILAVLVDADLLVILTDIDGLYTDDPHINQTAKLIPVVTSNKVKLYDIAKDTHSDVGTGGMYTKVKAAEIVNEAGIDMVITNGNRIDRLLDILKGREVGTLFVSHKENTFNLKKYING